MFDFDRKLHDPTYTLEHVSRHALSSAGNGLGIQKISDITEINKVKLD